MLVLKNICVSMSVCHSYTCACRGQKSTWDFLQLQLPAVVNYLIWVLELNLGPLGK